ncbi:MAG: toprim domain-containing protein, partial [Planctomycetia bacterium]
GLATWAAISAGGLKKVDLPSQVRTVHLWADNDANNVGQDAAEAAAKRFHEEGRTVYVLSPPAVDMDWLDVFIDPSLGAECLARTLATAKPWTPADVDPRTKIVVTHDYAVVNDETLAALADGCAALYSRGGRLVRIVRPVANRPPQIAEVVPETLRELVSTVAVFVEESDGKEDDAEKKRTPAPRNEKALLARGEYPGFRFLAGVATAPTLRPDGSVFDRPGYDPESGLFHAFDGGAFPSFATPPTKDDARAAADRLYALVNDFPFLDAGHRAAWLALALTTAVRPLIDGPVPLFAFDAARAGTGKTKLAELYAALLTIPRAYLLAGTPAKTWRRWGRSSRGPTWCGAPWPGSANRTPTGRRGRSSKRPTTASGWSGRSSTACEASPATVRRPPAKSSTPSTPIKRCTPPAAAAPTSPTRWRNYAARPPASLRRGRSASGSPA